MDYIYDPETSELYHYGVKGMRWGVRHNPSKAFAKAAKKGDRLEKKVYKEYQKHNKRVINAAVKVSKREDLSSAEKAELLKRRFDDIDNDHVIKACNRALDWYDQMDKAFSTVKVSDIDSDVLNKHRRYRSILADN